MRDADKQPLDPMDSVFSIGDKQYALVCKDGDEYLMALVTRVGSTYYKYTDDFERFPASTIAGISDQCGFVRARDLPHPRLQ